MFDLARNPNCCFSQVKAHFQLGLRMGHIVKESLQQRSKRQLNNHHDQTMVSSAYSGTEKVLFGLLQIH